VQIVSVFKKIVVKESVQQNKESKLFIPVILFCMTVHVSSCTLVAKPGEYHDNLDACMEEAVLVAKNMQNSEQYRIAFAMPYCVHAKNARTSI
tara:strand:- start:4796 stop:5074 length:279 start_codon:yes stop_codon:yes gene_type:complete